jgi:hypothetical protein
MTGWASAAAGLAGLVAAAVPSSVLFTFADPEIAESSGLVDAASVVYTVNDSGSGPVLYGVDPATGRTATRTTYTSDEVVDVEALAPGRGDTVWVGDVGDNGADRDGVALYRVRPGSAGDAARLDLRYPDGPRDAETVLAHPRTGRLFVVSKNVFGGTVYAVPPGAGPGAPVTMRPFAQVPGLVTDGAFLPDGDHVVLRGYGTATVLTFPAFEVTGTVDLPEQRQGEAISVGRDGRVLVSSEGVGSDVLRVRLPADLTTLAPAPSPPPSTAAESPARPSAGAPDAPDSADGAGGDEREPAASGRGGLWSHPLAAAARVLMGVALLGALGLTWWRLRNR